MANRNRLLRQTATNLGVTADLSQANRNEILLEIANHLGVFPTKTWRNNVLMSILAILKLAAQPSDKTRNWYLKQIAEHYGATGLSDTDAMDVLLISWRDNAAPVVDNNQFPAGTWDTALTLDFAKFWNFTS